MTFTVSVSSTLIIMGFSMISHTSGAFFAPGGLLDSISSSTYLNNQMNWCKYAFADVGNVAVQYCITNYEKIRPKLKGLDFPQCMACKKVVELVVQHVRDNYSQESIIQELDKFCDTLSIQSALTFCKNNVKKVVENITSTVQNLGNVNSQMICFTLRCCYTPFVLFS